MDNERTQIIRMRISFRFVFFFQHLLLVDRGGVAESSARKPSRCLPRIKGEINVMREMLKIRPPKLYIKSIEYGLGILLAAAVHAIECHRRNQKNLRFAYRYAVCVW